MKKKILKRLCDEIKASIKSVKEYEVIFIDDGSSDNSFRSFTQIKKKNSQIEIISFRDNLGQTAATLKGFKKSKGRYVIPLDGDLQMILLILILGKLKREKLDILFGIRKNRKDHFFRKILSSIANKLIKFLFKGSVSDLGCSMRCYKKEVIKDLFINNEQHRILPIILTSKILNTLRSS